MGQQDKLMVPLSKPNVPVHFLPLNITEVKSILKKKVRPKLKRPHVLKGVRLPETKNSTKVLFRKMFILSALQ